MSATMTEPRPTSRPGPKPTDPLVRFWNSVDKTGSCWTWTARVAVGTGYGQFWTGKNKVNAHKWIYEQEVGTVPAGMEVDHTCRNRSCVRPAHLRTTTHKQNAENRAGAQVNSRSGIRGVWWSASENAWAVQVKHHGVRYSGGLHRTPQAAEAAAIALRNQLFTHNEADRARSK